jgi:arabinan endo-1,5-alpha-L-arabinosidase
MVALATKFQAGRMEVPNWSAFPGDAATAVNAENVHDPTVVAFKGSYFCFSTSGDGFGVLRSSKDLKSWTVHGAVLPETPEWIRQRYRHRSTWAPDIVVLGDKLRMYYCVSNFGTNQSVIGVAECERFDPAQPQKGWRDLGLVLESKAGQDVFNAIDPETVVDDAGRHWLYFGSYFGGLYVIELDPATGKLKNAGNPEPILVARNEERGNPLEAAAVAHRDGYYYLFVSYGLAAQGVQSTYRIMVGRAKTPTGPFLDLRGRAMAEGGYVNVLKGSSPMFSPGHSDVLRDPSGRWLMPYHFYDGRRNWHGDKWGLPTLQVRELLWSADGWPLPGMPVESNPKPSRPFRRRDLVGRWVHQVDFGNPAEIEMRADGTIRNGDERGTWELTGDRLVLRWPRRDAPGEFYVDTVQVAYGGTYYVGRNQVGVVIRGSRRGR